MPAQSGNEVRKPWTAVDFGAKARSYDAWYRTPTGRMYDALEKRAVARALPTHNRGAKLLDAGCGTGHWSAFFAAQGFAVTGVDVSREMVDVATEKRISGASFQIADVHALPFDDEAFDVSVAITTLEFVRDARTALGELARCTRRAGGVVLVGVLNALAAINRERKSGGSSTYAAARFYRPEEVHALLAPYGAPRVTVAGFVPRSKAVLPLAGLWDVLGRLSRSRRGAFIVGSVVR